MDIKALVFAIVVGLVFWLSYQVFSYLSKCYVAYIQLNLLTWQKLSKGHSLEEAKNKALEELKQISSFARENQNNVY
jgi:predicted negative regulator of RcsB-dependent stress response